MASAWTYFRLKRVWRRWRGHVRAWGFLRSCQVARDATNPSVRVPGQVSLWLVIRWGTLRLYGTKEPHRRQVLGMWTRIPGTRLAKRSLWKMLRKTWANLMANPIFPWALLSTSASLTLTPPRNPWGSYCYCSWSLLIWKPPSTFHMALRCYWDIKKFQLET